MGIQVTKSIYFIKKLLTQRKTLYSLKLMNYDKSNVR